jgi:hypothetical protein
MATLREDGAGLEARLDQTEASAAGLDLHTQLGDDVEREGTPRPTRTAPPHAAP